MEPVHVTESSGRYLNATHASQPPGDPPNDVTAYPARRPSRRTKICFSIVAIVAVSIPLAVWGRNHARDLFANKGVSSGTSNVRRADWISRLNLDDPSSCTSIACIEAALDLEDYIDDTNDPCKDFYQYACGKFAKSGHAGIKELQIDAFTWAAVKLALSLNETLRLQFDDLQSLKSVRLARDFYKTCTGAKKEKNSKANAKMVADLKNVYGGLPLIGQIFNEDEFNLEYLMGKITANEGIGTMVVPSVAVDWGNVSRYSLYIDQAHLGISQEQYLLQPDKFRINLKAYKLIIVKTAKALILESRQSGEDSDVDEDVLEAEADAIIELEGKLAKMKTLEEERRLDYLSRYNPVSFASLMKNETTALANKRNGNNTDANNAILKDISYFNWSKFFSAFLSPKVLTAIQTGFTNEQIVVIRGLEFLRKFRTLYQSNEISKRQWQNYLLWRVVKSRAAILNVDMEFDSLRRKLGLDDDSDENSETSLRRHVEEIVYRGRGTRRSDVAADTTFCIDLTKDSFAWPVARIYAAHDKKKSHSTEMKSSLAEFTDSLITSVESFFAGLEWMNNATRAKALQKSRAIVKNLAYPDWIFNDTKLEYYYADLFAKFDAMSAVGARFRRDSWTGVDMYDKLSILSKWGVEQAQQALMGHQAMDRGSEMPGYIDANAYYMLEENAILIPAPILRSPFYELDNPKAINYGALGAVVGHEISHGFDDEGVQFYDNGTLLPWLNKQAHEGFKQMQDCVINQYSKYCYKDLDQCINGASTQGENLADNAGVKAAWRAFKAYEAEHGKEKVLPMTTGVKYSNDQLFFLSFGRLWCEAEPEDDDLTNQLQTDVHSPNRWRVNGVLRNFKPFAETWKCAPDSGMNPPDRCNVW